MSMNPTAGRVLVFAMFVWVGIATPSAADWRRIDSPNFVVIGDVNPRTLRNVAIEFEGFRESLSRLITERPTSAPVPTIVIVFPTVRAFAPFKPIVQGKPAAASGVFVGRQDANYIAVVADDADGLRPVLHEYAHQVISNLLKSVPAWVGEGLAEYYSTYESGKDGREAVVGRAIANHVRLLQDTRLLKIDDLLKVDRGSPLYNEKDRRSIFFAQSWALTHWMLRTQPANVTALSTYLNRVSEGAEPLSLWKQIFGAVDMEQQLEAYVRQPSLQTGVYTLSDKLAKFEGNAAPVAAAEAEAFLGEFLMRIDRKDDAGARLAAAVKLDPENLRVRTTSALLDLARGEYEKANLRLLSTSNTSDWLIGYSAAAGIAEIVDHQAGIPEASQVEAVRRLFGLSAQLRGDLANALARASQLEAKSAAGPTKETRTAIERARLMATGRADYVLIHAQVLARLTELGAARQVIAPLISPVYPEEIRESARSLMSQIVELESTAQARAEADQPQTAETESKASEAAAPSIIGYRTLLEGEQRVEGVLERIECIAGGNAIFHVRTADGVFRASGRLKNIDFVAYRNDLSSHVTCGPRKPPLPIYLTWRNNPDKPTEKMAVAIEFLPQ